MEGLLQIELQGQPLSHAERLDDISPKYAAVAPKATRVLIVDYDLYSSLGGGQTFYRRLIELNPHIHFYFLQRKSREVLPLPPNAFPVPLIRTHKNKTKLQSELTTFLGEMTIECLNIASSVKNLSFDIVDIPDYQKGAFLRQAFHYHGVKYGKIAAALHGSLSNVLNKDWNKTEGSLGGLKFIERLQYEGSDIRYGISPRYISQWESSSGIRADFYDPIQIASEFFKSRVKKDKTKKPNIFFIGRSHKWKGPDLAVDLMAALPRDLRQELTIIGPKEHELDSSYQLIRDYAERRKVDVSFGGMAWSQDLKRYLDEPSIILLPSRVDTFNLAALEALLSGCPTFIGSGAGVCDYLRKYFPELPFYEINIEQIYSSVDTLSDVIRNFAKHQALLEDALDKVQIRLQSMELQEIYDRTEKPVLSSIEMLEAQFDDVLETLGIPKPTPQTSDSPPTKRSLYRRARSGLRSYLASFPFLKKLKAKLVRAKKKGPRAILRSF